jgi:two-component system chemotaxis response regulator CheY
MPLKILVIDDSLLARMAVKKSLPESPPYELAEAADGAQGIKLFGEMAPDIVFTDLTMPVISGFAVLEMLRKLDPRVPVIVLSADIQKRTYEKVMELGAFRMLRKPPQKEEIRRALADALALRTAGGATP